MNTIEVIRVDVWDGGERHNFGFYLNAATCSLEEVKLMRKYDNVRLDTVIIFDSLEDVEANSALEVKRRLWHRMTPHERKVMGMLEEPK